MWHVSLFRLPEKCIEKISLFFTLSEVISGLCHSDLSHGPKLGMRAHHFLLQKGIIMTKPIIEEIKPA
jgi:hypothetical protein